MFYPAKITLLKSGEYKLEFPDLPGCHTQNISVEAVMKSAEKTIADHLQILAEYGEKIPHASMIDEHLKLEQPNLVSWTIIAFDIAPYLGKSHKINVTLPELLIKRIDDRVSTSENYKTRSGFIADACISELNKK